MEYYDRGGEIEVAGVSDFNLSRIFECGQCFRWNADEYGVYTGVALNHAAYLRHAGKSVFISGSIEDFENIWRDYFDLDRDYGIIRQRLCIDDFMRMATAFGKGLRILRQNRWEVLCSFIISQCNNIPRIKRIIEVLCLEFGESFLFNGKKHYTFPTAHTLAMLDEIALAPLRCGYRASYIIEAATAVDSMVLDLDRLSRVSPEIACKELKKLSGVGDKVANCAMLFGLNILNAFPLDVWIKRAINQYYCSGFDPALFSPYAGIAQQYMFYYIRTTAKTNASVD